MPTTYGFTGQRGDVVSGLDYYGSRYYDPVASQFTSGDSVLPGGGFDLWGLSRYAYVEGNPVERTDPSGHCFCDGPGSGDNFFPQSGGRLLNGETGEVFSGPGYTQVYHLDWSGYHRHHYQRPKVHSTPRPAPRPPCGRCGGRSAPAPPSPPQPSVSWGGAALAGSERSSGNDWLTVASAPFGVGGAYVMNQESLVGFPPYVIYNEAYNLNRRFPNSPIPGFNGTMSGLQRLALHGDEAWDRFQQWNGYPGASENDERMRVNYLPSLIYPKLSSGRWQLAKVTYGGLCAFSA
jgi:RHS repeat-associated protein